MLVELNDIEKYKALKDQVNELETKITNACISFIEKYYPTATFAEWKLNERKTLVVIVYIDEDKNKEEHSYKLPVSFDELQSIIHENELKLKEFVM